MNTTANFNIVVNYYTVKATVTGCKFAINRLHIITTHIQVYEVLTMPMMNSFLNSFTILTLIKCYQTPALIRDLQQHCHHSV